jgi:hypothetical protein
VSYGNVKEKIINKNKKDHGKNTGEHDKLCQGT